MQCRRKAARTRCAPKRKHQTVCHLGCRHVKRMEVLHCNPKMGKHTAISKRKSVRLYTELTGVPHIQCTFAKRIRLTISIGLSPNQHLEAVISKRTFVRPYTLLTVHRYHTYHYYKGFDRQLLLFCRWPRFDCDGPTWRRSHSSLGHISRRSALDWVHWRRVCLRGGIVRYAKQHST